ncbi:unnamed protein product [Peniophora sp. CBMAI 1063]|nr:unnamed protein product [Peniophora sp. CBMAI 1063]
MSTYTVTVTGIAPTTTQQQLNDFFSFCGKIQSIDLNEKAEPRTAVVHFEKPSAAKTALILNGGSLDGAHLSVTSDTVHEDEEHDAASEHIDQSDKPRAGIVAEYLARGYTLSDQILQRAIEVDSQKGISKRFLTYFQSLDTTLGEKALGPEKTISGKVSETIGNAHKSAKSIDEQKGITKTAWDYYAKALSTPVGQKVRTFYTTTSKQVLDIHEEARRIAAEHKSAAAPAATPAPAASGPVDEAFGSEQKAPTVV